VPLEQLKPGDDSSPEQLSFCPDDRAEVQRGIKVKNGVMLNVRKFQMASLVFDDQEISKMKISTSLTSYARRRGGC
jgi:hypothetical protein